MSTDGYIVAILLRMAIDSGVCAIASFVALCSLGCGGRTTATGATTPGTDAAGAGGASPEGASTGGGTSSGGAGVAGSAGAVVDGGASASVPGQPPPPPVNGVDASALPRSVFAVRTWYLGDVDWSGNATQSACWDYAWDLDAQTFPKPLSKKHCITPSDGPSPLYGAQDGPLGVDNRLGCLVGAVDTFSAKATALAAGGLATLLVTIDHLGPGNDYTGTTGAIGSAAGSVDSAGNTIAPTDVSWTDGSYAWRPLVGDFLATACFSEKQIAYPAAAPLPNGYVSDGTWVAGGFGAFTVVIPLGTHQTENSSASPVRWFPLRLKHGWVTARLSDDRKRLYKGMLGGITSVEDAEKTLEIAFGCTGLCGPIAPRIADMMADGTQEPTKPCNGVSVSFGFEAVLVTEGDGVAVPAIEGAPCAP